MNYKQLAAVAYRRPLREVFDALTPPPTKARHVAEKNRPRIVIILHTVLKLQFDRAIVSAEDMRAQTLVGRCNKKK